MRIHMNWSSVYLRRHSKGIPELSRVSLTMILLMIHQPVLASRQHLLLYIEIRNYERVAPSHPADAIPKGHTINRVPTIRAINCQIGWQAICQSEEGRKEGSELWATDGDLKTVL